jgi:hypothetical protein
MRRRARIGATFIAAVRDLSSSPLFFADQDPVARRDRVARLFAVPRHDVHQPAEAKM